MAKTEGWNWEVIKDKRGDISAIRCGEYVILKVELWSDMHYFAQYGGKLVGVCLDAERGRQLCRDHAAMTRIAQEGNGRKPIPEVDLPRTGSDQR